MDEQTDKRLIHRGCQQELISETLKEKNSSFSLRLEIVEGEIVLAAEFFG